MDSRSGVRIEGLREAVRALERAGVELSDLKAAFRKIGQNVADDAQTNVNDRSGRLASSIRPSNTKNKAVVRAGSARVPYAGVIEYGGYNNITPQSYLRDAVDRNRQSSVNELEAELEAMARRLGLA